MCFFKLEEGSVFRHDGERKIRTLEEDEMSIADSQATEITVETTSDQEDGDSESDEEKNHGEGEDNDIDKEIDTSKDLNESATEEKVKSEDSESDEEQSDLEEEETEHVKLERTEASSGEHVPKNIESKNHKRLIDAPQPCWKQVKQQEGNISKSDGILVVQHSSNVSASERKKMFKEKASEEHGVKDEDVKPAVVEFPDTEITLHHVKGDK